MCERSKGTGLVAKQLKSRCLVFNGSINFPLLQADLGLTAIPSSEVLDIMSRDFYEKYEEYMSVVEQRKDRSRGLQTYSTAVTVERHQLANFLEKAVQDTSAWNKRMNMER